MRVEDLSKCEIKTPGNDDIRTSLSVEGCSPVDLWNSDTNKEWCFDNKDEALKAAALFRAAYEMQKALEGVLGHSKSKNIQNATRERVEHALALSKNTDQIAP